MEICYTLCHWTWFEKMRRQQMEHVYCLGTNLCKNAMKNAPIIIILLIRFYVMGCSETMYTSLIYIFI